MANRMTRREQQEQNRLRLLDAAEKVFADRGVEGASLDEVASEAGLTKGAVYSNFTGKEDLVLAVMRHRLGQEAQSQSERLQCDDDQAQGLVEDFGAYWAAAQADGEQQRRTLAVVEFMLHALRVPSARHELVELLLPPHPMDPHPLAPKGNELAKLPPEQVDALLKALDLGMSLMTMLAPRQCPPELFGVALRLINGMGIGEPTRPAAPDGPDAE